MIKRSESKSKSSSRNRSDRVSKQRRLMMEGLEKRELLAAGPLIPTVPNIPAFTGPRNVGTVQAFTFIESETLIQTGLNDSFRDADLVPLGLGPGKQHTIDVTGSMVFRSLPTVPSSFATDIDTFAFDLRAGDILDISAFGAAGSIDVSYASGTLWFATDANQAIFYPGDSPLQTAGNTVGAQVVPEDGRYYLTVSPIDTTANYTIGLRVYRPIVEQLPIGTGQFIFLDFDGGTYPRNVFPDGTGVPQGGIIRVPSLLQSLPVLGIQIQDERAYNELLDKVLAEVELNFQSVVKNGGNGDYDSSGIPGEYGVTILNSRDHFDPGFNPLVTRVVVGGTLLDVEQMGIIGLSSTIDVGNFSMDDIVIAVLDSIVPTATLFPIAATKSILDASARLIGNVISHEAAHSFGMRHTNSANFQASLIDSGGSVAVFGQYMGVGPDGIFGTIDDQPVEFVTDEFEAAEGFFGFERVADSMAFTLATGRAGGSVNGRVFRDANRDGSGASDLGLSGVTVFADLNGNNVADPSEPTATSGADGTYRLVTPPGSFNVIAVTPTDFAPTTPVSVATSATLSGSTVGINFGFGQVVSNITGTVFSDNDGNGFRDAGEGGVEGVYVYIDIDGDNRPDLGEPGTNSAANGSYSLNFPGPGTYTIREVVEPGFELTFPANGEHTVVYNGISLPDNYDFGNFPSRDLGDAPDSYGTTVSVGGASHGITAGLTIGSIVDREVDGQPNATATGDDLNGDDEDGVRLLSPLGPADSATFEVTATNTTGSPAFLQAFIDFDRDGNFLDPGEHFRVNVPVPSGTVNGIIPVEVTVPPGASVGTTYVRFRLSQTSGLGPTGFAATGEVEDYSFPILSAAEIANDDDFTVSRNTLSNQLDVLANDFQTFDNQLRIDSLNVNGTAGVVVRSSDQKSVFYTPPNGFIGRDVFSYTVIDEFGNRSSAAVVVNVTFQSNIPIALDDTFEVPEGSVNRALNVLDNDVPSTFGGISITSVTSGSAGGTLAIIGGGQSLRYTPLPGFNGTEQFTYSIQDAVGSTSFATVTVNLLPGSRFDDVVDFSIAIFDPVNTNTPVTNVQVGQDILVRVSVDDLRLFANPEGVASAFLDLLYTDELVATLNTDNNPDFPFDIQFGPLFSGINVFQRGDSQTPGLIDDVGGVQRIDAQQPHSGPAELFTLKMRAVSPGVAVFVGDPADEPVSETVVIGSDTALTPSQLRLGRAELLILPASANFTSAIDDSFPDGRDSNGNLITSASASRSRLDVLDNDNLGPTGTVREFGLVTSPSLGNVLIDDNGTPGNLNDDFFSYRANANSNGLERFTYVIVTDDNIRSTAEVTIALGNASINADVAFDFKLVSGDGSGRELTSVGVGERFGVQIIGEDLRFSPTTVFAGFLDVLYDTGIIRPSDIIQSDDYDFDVVIGPGYSGVADAGTALRPGIIDEFGAAFAASPSNPALLATLFFDAVGIGSTQIVGSPADSFPAHDTLLINEDEPIDVSRIRYDLLEFNVTGGPGTPLQNFALPQDVNNDGSVSPIDALLIINTMNRVSPAALGEGESIVASQHYTDVNGDQRTSALDALQVINYLKRASDSEGLSEAVGQQLSSHATDLSTGGADVVFADLDQNDLTQVVSNSLPANQTSAVGVSVDGGGAADDDEEDLLDLLADDVKGLWG